MSELLQIVTGTPLQRQQVLGRQLDIFQTTLRQSRILNAANFRNISESDLRLLFELYDDTYFDNQLHQTLQQHCSELTFRLSRRMTSAGGKTTRWQYPRSLHRPPRFEIAISATLLFESFNGNETILVTGLTCENRLEALQRVMEHEIVHLIEMLLWYHSSCSARRFLKIASNFFQHRKASHELLTPADIALSRLGIQVGDRVSFELNGQSLQGFVNRITRRATVLVANRKGQAYNDGARYLKYYVPLELLRRA